MTSESVHGRHLLLVWEHGAGTGHATHSAPLANALARRGHRVFASLPDPAAPS